MPKNTTFSRHCLVVLALFTLLLLMACGKKETTIPAEQAKQQAAAAPGVSSPDELPASGAGGGLPVGFGRSTGDLAQMAKQREPVADQRRRPDPAGSCPRRCQRRAGSGRAPAACGAPARRRTLSALVRERGVRSAGCPAAATR